MVFDDKSSIAFFSLDKELEKYISDRIKQLESEAGAKVGPSGMAQYRYL